MSIIIAIDCSNCFILVVVSYIYIINVHSYLLYNIAIVVIVTMNVANDSRNKLRSLSCVDMFCSLKVT